MLISPFMCFQRVLLFAPSAHLGLTLNKQMQIEQMQLPVYLQACGLWEENEGLGGRVSGSDTWL